MQNDLRKDAAARRVLLVAHRGSWGGDIPCNTIASYDIAFAHGADMLEIDVDMTSDGKLVIFHPWMERPLLGYGDRIANHPWSFVKELRYQNIDDCPTPFGICTFEEVLDRFRGWHRARELVRACRFVGFGRPGFRLDPDVLGFDPATNTRLAADFVPDFAEPASSTEVRARLAAGEDVSSLLPSPVARYVADRALYRPAPPAPRADAVSVLLARVCFAWAAALALLSVAWLAFSFPRILGAAVFLAAGGFLFAGAFVRALVAGGRGEIRPRFLATACAAVFAVCSAFSFAASWFSVAEWRAPYDICEAFGDDAYPGLIGIVGFRYHPPMPWSGSSYAAWTEFRAASPRFFCEETDSGAERAGADVARLAIRKARKTFPDFRPEPGETVFVVARNGAPRWTIILGDNPSECVVLAE